MKLNKSLAAVYAVLLLTAGIAGAEDAMDKFKQLLQPRPHKPQQIILQDSATSPDGTWVAERYLKVYSQDTEVGIAIHHPQNSPATPLQYIPFKSVDNDVLFKWLGNSNLLIAVPEGHHMETELDQFGVHLQYGQYPDDPDTPRVIGEQRLFTKKLDFSYRFEKGDGEGTPGVGCYLYITAPEGNYLEYLSLKITALREFELRGMQANVYKVIPGYEIAAVNIDADQETKGSLSYATSAKIEKFSPKINHGDPLMSRNFKQAGAVNEYQDPRWNWDTSYSLHDKDIFKIINELKNGNFYVKVGFWLDNATVKYTSSAPQNISAFNSFERCISDNNVFTNQEQTIHN